MQAFTPTPERLPVVSPKRTVRTVIKYHRNKVTAESHRGDYMLRSISLMYIPMCASSFRYAS